MDYLIDNLKFLRKKNAFTQEELARQLNLKKSTYASYEVEEGNTPPAKTLYAIARTFDVSMDSLFEVDYQTLNDQDLLKISERETYFPVSVDLDGNELIDVVPSGFQAQAGYLNEYSDPAYISSLPKISWNLGTYESGTKRIFQISGDSMLPIPSRSFILGIKKEYGELVDNQAYILVTQHDILFKRIRKEGPLLHLISDNPVYPPQKIKSDEVRQYWLAVKAVVDIPDENQLALASLAEIVSDTRDKVDEVLRKLP